jgi:hypothetical protein
MDKEPIVDEVQRIAAGFSDIHKRDGAIANLWVCRK